MEVLLIGGSSFIGKNLIEKAPESWNIEASYCHANDFIKFVSEYSNVEPFYLNLMEENTVPKLGQKDIVIYLAGKGPGQVIGDKQYCSKVMYNLHSKGISLISRKIERCSRFIYLSSGIFYLKNDYSDYRKSRLLGEANVQAIGLEGLFNYVILRNMEIYGPYMAKHKIYRRLCMACADGVPKFHVQGDGKNLIATMYVDDYINILIKAVESDVENEIVPMCRAKPVTIEKLASSIGKVFSHPEFQLSFGGKPTEDTRFVLNNDKMISLFGIEPKTCLEEGLKRWKKRGIV